MMAPKLSNLIGAPPQYQLAGGASRQAGNPSALSQAMSQQPQMNNLPPLGTEQVGRTQEGRAMIQNPDNSVSTERTITGPWGPNGEWVNIPSMFGGKQLSEEEAVQIMRDNGWIDPETNREAVFFPTVDEAVAAARARSQSIPVDR
jgi:hypothetical protein